MIQYQNGTFRRSPDSTPDTWRKENGGRYFLHQDTDGPFYYQENFMQPEPWLAFAAQPVHPPLPAGFAAIFGPEPIPDGTTEQTGLLNAWRQQLGLFKSAGMPAWVTPQMAEDAKRVFAQYGLANCAPYTLATGKELVRFPNSIDPTFELDATLVYTYAALGIALFQSAHRDKYTSDQLIPWLQQAVAGHSA
jgi:hypothetical protein